MAHEASVREVLAAEEAWNVAVAARDKSALDSILSDDLRYIHTGGHVQDKADFIAVALERGNRYDLEGVEVHVTGDTAMTLGARGQSHVMKVWAKVGGSWKLAARQAMVHAQH